MNAFLAFDIRLATARIRAGQYREASWTLESAKRLCLSIGDTVSAERVGAVLDALKAYMRAVNARDVRPLWSAYPRIMRSARFGAARWDTRPVHR